MKEIHIVFKVLNFIMGSESDSYALLPIHRLLLIALAKHHGLKGIYPSVSTLSKELKLSERYTRECILYIESLNLIKIERKTGCSSHYFFEFLSTDLVSVDQGCAVDHPGTVDHTTPDLQFRDPAAIDHPINTYNQIKRNKSERGVKKECPLPPDFWPDEESIELGVSLGLSKSIIEDFKDYCADKGIKSYSWNARFRKYLKDEAKYREKHFKEKPVSEIHSTVPFVEPIANSQVVYTSEEMAHHREVGQRAVKNILKDLRMNGQGGHEHGNELGGEMAKGARRKAQ